MRLNSAMTIKKYISLTCGPLIEDTDFTDVTLACEDGYLFEAYKVTLAVSSPFFQNFLKKNNINHSLI